MHRNKVVAASVAALALAVPASALATDGSCTAKGKSQVQCGSQSSVIKQGGIALGGSVSNNAVNMQLLRQHQNRGFQINLGLF